MEANYLFYFCDGIGSVFDSQVLAFLKAISEKKLFNKVYLFLGIKNKNQKNEFLARKALPEIEIVLFKSYPNYPIFNFMICKSIKNALLSQSIEFKEAVFHTRGELMAWHLRRVLGKQYFKNIIPDVRGASIEEIDEFYDSNKFLKYLKIVNYKNALKKLNRFLNISVVSNSLKSYLTNNYKIDQRKIAVIPSIAGEGFKYNESNRVIIRKDLKLDNVVKLVVFSSGGTAKWQNNNVIIKLAEIGLKVLNLSKKEIQHKNVINKFVCYQEMPLYLNAADVAIIWRDKSVVNKVASPVKFSEYVCAGLPLIANRNVDMISEYIIEHECGILLDNLENIVVKTINELSSKDRKKISEDGIKNFGVDAVVEKYLQIYSSINK